MTSNPDQSALWNGPSGEAWVAMQDHLDRELFPLGRAAMDALEIRAGDRVIDVGCGSGQTTIELAARVGVTGRVVGIDISEPLLALARHRSGVAATFIAADAQTHPFEAASFDAMYSRFGVMFFADPVAAFANIARGLAAGGRLGFVCWRSAGENPLMTAPIAAAIAVGLPAPAPAPPDAPGPFAFADRDRLAHILTTAGFRNIAITAHDERIGGSDLETSVELAFQIGPLARALRERPELRATFLDPVRTALAGYVDGGILAMPSATWIVTARR